MAAASISPSATLGSYGGEASHVQTLAEMPSHGHTATATMDAQGMHAHSGTTATAGDHFHQVNYNVIVGYGAGGGAGAVNGVGGSAVNTAGFTLAAGTHAHRFGTDAQGMHAHNISVSVAGQGSSAAMNWLPPFILSSTYIKL